MNHWQGAPDGGVLPAGTEWLARQSLEPPGLRRPRLRGSGGALQPGTPGRSCVVLVLLPQVSMVPACFPC